MTLPRLSLLQPRPPIIPERPTAKSLGIYKFYPILPSSPIISRQGEKSQHVRGRAQMLPWSATTGTDLTIRRATAQQRFVCKRLPAALPLPPRPSHPDRGGGWDAGEPGTSTTGKSAGASGTYTMRLLRAS